MVEILKPLVLSYIPVDSASTFQSTIIFAHELMEQWDNVTKYVSREHMVRHQKDDGKKLSENSASMRKHGTIRFAEKLYEGVIRV